MIDDVNEKSDDQDGNICIYTLHAVKEGKLLG